MENIKIAFDCVLPIGIILAVGYLFARKRLVPPEFFLQLSKLNFYALGLFLMFDSVYHANLSASFHADVIFFLCAYSLVAFALAGFLCRRFVADLRERGAFWQSAFRGNIGVIGIALARELMREPAMEVFIVAVLGALFNTLAVTALESLRGKNPKPAALAWEVLKNPLVLGCLGGLVCNLLHITFPPVLDSTITKIGGACVPMSLIALGATLDIGSMRLNAKRVLFGCALKLILVPAPAVLLGIVLGFRDDTLCAVMLSTAMPLPTAAFTMAQVYDSDYNLTGQIVVVSSLFCCTTLFCWIFLLKQAALI